MIIFDIELPEFTNNIFAKQDSKIYYKLLISFSLLLYKFT